MAFLGKLGKTLGLGSTEQVMNNIANERSIWYKEPAEKPHPNLQFTLETKDAGNENQAWLPGLSGRRILPEIFGGVTDALGWDIFGRDDAGGVCSTSRGGMAPYGINKEKQCVTVSRRQQARLKQMVGMIGLEATASAIGLTEDILVQLLLKRFQRRSAGITSGQMKTTRKTIRKFNRFHADLQEFCKTPVRRRRSSASSRVQVVKA